MTGFIDAFVRSDSLSFGEMDMMLVAPRRGHTCRLIWFVADGDLVPSDKPLFHQESDADPEDYRSMVSPFPARVQILQPTGRFLRSGQVVGRLVYGHALEASFCKEWKEPALELAAEFRQRRQALPVPDIPPRDLVRLVFLDFVLVRALEKAGLRTPPPVIPDDLRGDRALATLEQSYRWKRDAVRAAAPKLPDDVSQQTLLLWKHIFDNLAAMLRYGGLAPGDGLTADPD